MDYRPHPGHFGLKQLGRYAGRYTDTSKLFATLTLALGGLAGLVIVPVFIVGFCRGIDRARMEKHREEIAESGPVENSSAESRPAESPAAESQPLDFKNQNFTFHPPGSPWRKVNASDFGPNVLYALWRPGPMSFTIIQQRQRVGVIVLDPRHDMVVASKMSMRRTMESARVMDEKAMTYHGMAGWQIETEGIIRGHDTYFVQWLYATNGFGYQLSAFAPRSAKVELQVEADRLFGRFELTPPQQVTATSSP